MVGAVLTICVLTTPVAAPLDLEPGDLKPGLIAVYRSCVNQLAQSAGSSRNPRSRSDDPARTRESRRGRLR